jgi:hypothetical protein
MKMLIATAIVTLLAVPVWAGESRPNQDDNTFNFDLPFEEAFDKQVLRSLLNRALNAVEDHIEVNGRLRRGDHAGDREGRLELRLYPNGKSRSDEHVGAEWSFRFSPDAGNAELNLRFKSSKPSSSSTTSNPADFL